MVIKGYFPFIFTKSFPSTIIASVSFTLDFNQHIIDSDDLWRDLRFWGKKLTYYSQITEQRERQRMKKKFLDEKENVTFWHVAGKLMSYIQGTASNSISVILLLSIPIFSLKLESLTKNLFCNCLLQINWLCNALNCQKHIFEVSCIFYKMYLIHENKPKLMLISFIWIVII